MEVCIVNHKVIYGDGQGRVNFEIAKRLYKEGFKITLLASEVDSKFASRPGVQWYKINVSHYPTALLKNQIFALKSWYWLKRNHKRYDLILANGFITWFPADINVSHFVHNAWLQSPVHTSRVLRGSYAWYQWFYTAVNAWLEPLAYHSSKIVIAVSELVKKQLIDAGIPKEKINIIPNGVDLKEFHPGNEADENLCLPKDVPLALFAGDLRTPRKNLDTVLAALVHVPELHLIVLGDIKGSIYPGMVKEMSLTNRVHFFGYRRDIALFLRNVDMFIFPSRYEACSLVLFEALASGIPVITAKTAGGAEFITEDCGFVLDDPNDVVGLAEYLRLLVDHPEVRHEMGIKARERAKDYSWNLMTEKYLKVFKNIIG